jgi:hypothetical protein
VIYNPNCKLSGLGSSEAGRVALRVLFL